MTIELTNKEFGCWTVLKFDHTTDGRPRRVYWLCLCKCGKEKTVLQDNLIRGLTKSCGCQHIQDLTGERFGRLIVIRVAYTKRFTFWLCRCDCGNEVAVAAHNLKKSYVQSCGCLRSDSGRKHADNLNQTTHGQAGHDRTAEYKVWAGMKRRCQNPHEPAYEDYGARGITLCKGWQPFENFFADMGRRPSATHSIDRKDNDKGYWCGHCNECVTHNREPNCRWATMHEQTRNRRTSRLLTFRNEKKTMAEWCEHLGLSQNVVEQRLRVLHWSVERALTEPVRA